MSVVKNFITGIVLTALCWAAGVSCRAPRHSAPDCIVSLSPSVTYTLQQMGCDAKVAGRTTYCPPPDSGNTSRIVGNVLDVNLEEIIALKPGAVLCMSFTKPDVIAKLQAAGITVVNFSTPESFEQICEQTLRMGRLTGEYAAARALVERERRHVARIVEEYAPVIAQKNCRRVFFQIGENPVSPVIEGTYMNEYLTFLGLENVVKNYRGGGLDREYVLRSKPDVMLVCPMGGTAEEVAEKWTDYTVIPAVANRRIGFVDDKKSCCPTPVFFAETLQCVAEYFAGL